MLGLEVGCRKVPPQEPEGESGGQPKTRVVRVLNQRPLSQRGSAICFGPLHIAIGPDITELSQQNYLKPRAACTTGR